jgi:proline dehydrogenase
MLERLIRDFGNFFFLRIMGRWVAGARAEDAVAYCRKLNARGSSCVINFLGEHYRESKEAEAAVAEYRRLVDLISSSGVKAAITIKPSQFGFNALDIEDPKSFCEDNMAAVASYAGGKGLTTWLDMESSRFTDFTISFYRKYSGRLDLGLCLQANLKRTPGDLESLIRSAGKAPLKIRLVKGIYKEDPSISITDGKELHKRYLDLMREAFGKSPPSSGIAVGTHHPEAVSEALMLRKRHPKAFFDLEVLMGVLPSYYEELRKKGVNVTEYVPYGPDSFAYSVRRALKNPSFAKSILFSIFFDAYKKLYGKSE